MSGESPALPAEVAGDWRCAMWRALAGIFAAPLGEAAVASWRGGAGAQWLDELRRLPALQPAIEQMHRALQRLPAGADGTAELAWTYTRLFSGAAGPATVPPYESAFTEPSGRLFGAAASEMAALLTACDLHVALPGNEPADHLAVELALAAELQSRADRPGRGALFARLHGWVFAFCEACSAADAGGFYGGAAMLLAAFLRLHDESAERDHSSAAGDDGSALRDGTSDPRLVFSRNGEAA